MYSFIETYQMKDLSWIDPLIDFFEKSDKKVKGKLVGGEEQNYKSVVNEKEKNSTDLYLYNEYLNKDLLKCMDNYYDQLQNCLKDYLKKYVFLNDSAFFHPYYPVNMQRYLPSEGYFKWHFERGSNSTARRILVYMTYLNDINDEGGETEWFYQNIKIKPKKGMTVLWPTDFTHTHRGLPTLTETKYILTGWYVLKNNN